jgi:hypothetical protein
VTTYEELVLKHNEIVAWLEHEDAEYTARVKPYQDAVKAILATLQMKLQEEKLQNVKTGYGTPYLRTSNSIKVADRAAFLNYIVVEGGWDMLDARALKTPVEEYYDKHGEPPPGITVEPFVSCRITGKQLEKT